MQTLRICAVSALAILLVAGSLAGGALPAAAQETAVQPLRGVPGTTFTFYATGFGSRGHVAYWAHDPNGVDHGDPSNRTDANREGRADWTWVAPPDAIPGTWQMVAQQIDRPDRLQVIEFEILPIEGEAPVPPPSPDSPHADAANVEPAVGEPGARFNFFATGFGRKEEVGYWFNMPNGQILSNDADYRAFASKSGRVDWHWFAPLDAMPGLWQVIVQGKSSGVVRSAFFEIRASGSAEEANWAVEPPVGGPRTTFAFFSFGFEPGEKVSYWAIAPDGDEVGRDRYVVRANDEGRADWFWRPPVAKDAMPGEWQMVAYGTRSTFTQVIPFEIVWEEDEE